MEIIEQEKLSAFILTYQFGHLVMIDRFAIGAQVEFMLLPGVVFGFLPWWQVLIENSFMLGLYELVSYPDYTDGEH